MSPHRRPPPPAQRGRSAPSPHNRPSTTPRPMGSGPPPMSTPQNISPFGPPSTTAVPRVHASVSRPCRAMPTCPTPQAPARATGVASLFGTTAVPGPLLVSLMPKPHAAPRRCPWAAPASLGHPRPRARPPASSDRPRWPRRGSSWVRCPLRRHARGRAVRLRGLTQRHRIWPLSRPSSARDHRQRQRRLPLSLPRPSARGRRQRRPTPCRLRPKALRRRRSRHRRHRRRRRSWSAGRRRMPSCCGPSP